MVATTSKKPFGAEDPLAYLPCRRLLEYSRNQIVYDEQNPSSGLYLIMAGGVKVTRTIEDGSETVLGIFRVDNFFGEGGLLGDNVTHSERATALEKSVLMSWTAEDIEVQIECQPKFGIALIQRMSARCMDFEGRLESLALDGAPERIALALLEFAKAGSVDADGFVRIPPLTHYVLAGYVGTTREIVTMEMNQWRRRGILQYSRKRIEIHSQKLADDLRNRRASKRQERTS